METKISFDDIEFTVNWVGEILKMGGPWIGYLSIGDEHISKNCLADNLIYQPETNLLFFGKYQEPGFTINFYNLNNKTVYEFERKFEMLYLNQFISKTKLEIFKSFNNTIPEKRLVFDFDEESFNEAVE